MKRNSYLLDISNRNEELEKLDKKFARLHDRFLAVAMDYKYYINPILGDAEIFKFRDNVIFRLQSARFHFNLLLQFQEIIESKINKMSDIDDPIIYTTYQRQATEEIYSLFDSMVYHVCSIFDYLFSLINFIHGETKLTNPKWNLFKSNKNLDKKLYCSEELIKVLDIIDQDFVYPLIKHRSHLIHTEQAVGNVIFNFSDQKVRFLVTKTLKNHFPNFEKENGTIDTTLGYAAKWLINKSFKSITDVLFELKDDMKRNKKTEIPLFFTLGANNTIQEPSIPYWGDRSII